MKKSLLNTILIIFGLLLGVIIAEFAVRLILPQNRMVTWLQMHPEGFMMNQAGGEAFQEYNDRAAYYRFTKTRLRGEPASQSKKTILAIGDSFTFGLLLNKQDTYIQNLQNKLSAAYADSIQILNGGVGGAGLADWPGWLKHFGTGVKPDVILYFMHTMDLDRSLSKNLYVLQGDSLYKTQRWQPREFMTKVGQAHWYRWLQANSDLANLIVKILWKHFYFTDLTNDFNQTETTVPIPSQKDLYVSSDYSLQLGISLLGKLQEWCAVNNCQLIVTTTGFFNQNYEPNRTSRLYNWLNEEPDSLLFESSFYDNTACVDSSTAGNYDSIIIHGDTHPNENGARIIADCTWNWLKAEI